LEFVSKRHDKVTKSKSGDLGAVSVLWPLPSLAGLSQEAPPGEWKGFYRVYSSIVTTLVFDISAQYLIVSGLLKYGYLFITRTVEPNASFHVENGGRLVVAFALDVYTCCLYNFVTVHD
jgi:hypothetical protein